MKFEYDSNKSDANLAKHGIDFDEAQALWHDENLLEAPLNFSEEKRFICIGKIGEKHWSAVITYRSEMIRIISVRRSRDVEVEYYENSSRV
ncbi:BrnT family toxin [Sulfuricurvum sp.]|uniref:BrnT family toxin n=1 Tax=Sulfuricurvum sp. TaxID=2025608 RepID=UPI003BB68B42